MTTGSLSEGTGATKLSELKKKTAQKQAYSIHTVEPGNSNPEEKRKTV